MKIAKLEAEFSPYYDDYEFRGDAKYFTYWLINHQSGNSYVIECSEADKNHPSATAIDTMINSIEYLCEPLKKDDAFSLDGAFSYFVVQRWERF